MPPPPDHRAPAEGAPDRSAADRGAPDGHGTDQRVARYYRAVSDVLLTHLAGRPLRSLAPGAVGDVLDAPTTATGLMAMVGAGVTGFAAVPTGRMVLLLTPGEGSDTATAATAALHLAEQCAADGLAPVPLTDGSGGLWLMAATDGDPAAVADRYLRLLTSTAPELATADRAGADGRTLVSVRCGRGADPVPIPYTLLPGTGYPAAVIPLHLDEVAAITAGMPAEIWADDVAGRVADRGDLASALLPRATA